jgi:hypothetical protein
LIAAAFCSSSQICVGSQSRCVFLPVNCITTLFPADKLRVGVNYQLDNCCEKGHGAPSQSSPGALDE